MQTTFDQFTAEGRKEIKINIQDQERIIELNGVKCRLKLRRDYFGEAQIFYLGESYCPHLELTSLNEEPNVISETGYRSMFFNINDLIESETFEQLAELILKGHFEMKKKEKRGQVQNLEIKWL